MIHRSLFRGLAAATLSLAVFATACGGDDDKNDKGGNDSATAEASVQASATRASASRPAATAVPNDGVAITVSGNAAATQYVPTADEFRALEKTSVKGQDGVSIATLAGKAGIEAPRLATIEGENQANGAFGAIRYPVADIGSNTVLVMDDRGHLTLVSDVIPEAELLTRVSSIVFE